MTESIQTSRNPLLKLLWLSMTASPVTIWAAMLVMDKLSILPKIQPEYSEYAFFAGLLVIVPAAILLRLFKNTNKGYLLDRQQTIQPGKESFDKLKQDMILGLAVADLPATLSLVYYFMSGDLDKSILLVASSFILCLLFKPELPASVRNHPDRGSGVS